MKDNISIRAYSKPSKMGRKFLGLPVFGWVLLMVAGFAAAAVVGPIFGPKSQTVTVVTLSYNALAGSDVSDPITYGVVDIVTLDASNSGGVIANAAVQVTISFGDTCTALLGKIADSAGTMGKLSVAISSSGTVGTYSSFSIPAGAVAPCVIPAGTFGSSTTLPSGSTVNFFSIKYQWLGTPTTNPGSWSFQAAV